MSLHFELWKQLWYIIRMPPSYTRHAYFCELQFPAIDTIDTLKGKSNFYRWHSDIQPVLLSNPHSSDLILGSWTEPQSPPSWSVEDQASVEEERREWNAANTATCRFIRATLAMNVGPFVRQYTTAKTLFFNLVWLYGEDAGIDTQGGPPVPMNAENVNAKKGRASLLAALEAKRTMDYLPPVCANSKPSASTAPAHSSNNNINNEVTSLSASATDSSAFREPSLKPTNTPNLTSTPDRNTTTARLFDRTHTISSSEPNLETIHEHDEPHPGRRVPSGYVIDFDFNLCSRGGGGRGDEAKSGTGTGTSSLVSPFSSGSEYDDDDYDDDEVRLLPLLPAPSKRTASSLRHVVLPIYVPSKRPRLLTCVIVTEQIELHNERHHRRFEDSNFETGSDQNTAAAAARGRNPNLVVPGGAKTGVGITSILKTVTTGTSNNKTRTRKRRDRFNFSFPLRRLTPVLGPGKAEGTGFGEREEEKGDGKGVGTLKG
ncbi:hypothetical protein AYO20_07980 [Fonsecaea nubica]|uniref:Uncharacterized protein n=1 Tax=Fonsecaea nubica TaxID=856822 RepID=A0A178CSQ8_9EURO|nr:hypothetical protein AYO20_07980 [Fonsecaea nubica]OAL32212.1 hypothetical protein AYO20_07980 [Fonsecaea nubica]